MADAKVIPFDDDRSRAGGSARPARRRSAGSGRGPTAASAVGTAAVSALPGQQDASKPQEEPERPGAGTDPVAGTGGSPVGWRSCDGGSRASTTSTSSGTTRS